MAVVSVGVATWEHQRVAALRFQIARLVDEDRDVSRAPAPRVMPAYDPSARQFLHERATPWAPMLHTLESGSMIGVTPAALEFNASDGTARVELNYADSTALLDYLARINEGASLRPGVQRWVLSETRLPPGGVAPVGAPAGGLHVGDAVASIRSSWLEPEIADLPEGSVR